MTITKEFKEAVAEFFNNHIENEGLVFGSWDKKMAWVGEQMNRKTSIGRAAIMFAMSKVEG